MCIVLPFVGHSQTNTIANQKEVTDCEATLAVATSEFSSGRFFSLPSILENCLKRGFTKEQRVRAYILLCQVHLINDNPAEAEASYLKLLQADPEYIATPEIDPIDVVYLSQKFTSRPIFTPSIKGGFSTSFVSLIRNLSPVMDSVSISKPLKLGWTLGGGVDWNMSDRLALSLDLLLSSRTIQKTMTNVFDGDLISQTATFTWLDIPLFLKFSDYTGKWRPYGYLGYGFHFNFSSNAQYLFENVSIDVESGSPTNTTDEANLDFTKRQNLFNRSFVVGGGLNYKVGKNYLSADLRMNIGLSNLAKTNSNLNAANPEYTRFSYVDDLYRLNSVQLLLGYTIPYYNPRRKGGWMPKGFLGKILYGKKAIAQ
jgi:hypothetical protein